MRRLIIAALLLAWASVASAQTYVTSAWDDTDPFTGDATGVVTISPTSGNTVCVVFGIQTTSRTVSSVVDSVGSTTYSLVGTVESAAAREAWMYCGIVSGSPTSITVTLNSAVGTGGFVGAIEFSGAHATDSIGNSLTYNDSTGTTHNSGTLTISGSSAVALAFVFGSNGTYTPDDYTSRYNATIGSDQALIVHKSITASDELNLTTGGNEGVAIVLAEILPAAAGGAPPRRLTLLGVGQ